MKISCVILLSCAILGLAGLAYVYVQREHYIAATGGGSGTINVLDYGAKGDGVTDDSAAFAKAFADAQTYGNDIVIPKKTYLVNATLSIADGMLIRANKAVIRHTRADRPVFLAQSVDDWVLEGPLTLIGTRRSPQDTGSEEGITIIGANRFIVDKVTMRDFSGAGMSVSGGKTSRGEGRGDRGKFSMLAFNNNRLGLRIASDKRYVTEYHLFTLLSFTANDTAVEIGSGNNIISTSNIVDNANGIDIVPATNGAHGIINAANINHNRGYSLRAANIPEGYSIVGSHIYGDPGAGAIDIAGSRDFHFTGGVIDAPLKGDSAPCGNALAGVALIGRLTPVCP
jgi:hypothetical protein